MGEIPTFNGIKDLQIRKQKRLTFASETDVLTIDSSCTLIGASPLSDDWFWVKLPGFRKEAGYAFFRSAGIYLTT